MREKKEDDYNFKKFTLSKNIIHNPFLNTEKFFELPNLNYVKNQKILFEYGKKFIDARKVIIKLQMNLNHYKILSNVHLPIKDEDINELKKDFSDAKNDFEELFEIDYKYYYGNKDKEHLLLKMKRKKMDLDALFEFIQETYKTFSEEVYIYNNEELKKFYFGTFNNIYNRYLESFYN